LSRGAPGWASVLTAGAMAVRPSGAFVWLGIAYCLWRRRDRGWLAVHIAIAAVAVTLVVASNYHFYGDPLRQSHVYHNQINFGAEMERVLAERHWSRGTVDIPFKHLVLTPFVVAVPRWKIALIWLHALAILIACWVGVTRRNGSDIHAIMLIWAVLNSV